MKQVLFSFLCGKITDVDIIIRKAKLKPDYAITLRLLLHHFEENKLIYSYIKDRYVAEFVNVVLKQKENLTPVEQKLAALVSSEETLTHNQPRRSSFSFLNEQSFILKWEDVRFENKKYTIYPSKDSNITFVPYEVHDNLSSFSLNYIKDFIQEKLPNIACTVVKGRLRLDSVINLDVAIRILNSPMYKEVIEKRKNKVASVSTFEFPKNDTLSFAESMSKARAMSREDFRKYKSKFISFLLGKHLKEYKVIPCNECIKHSQTPSYIENAFIFTLRSSRSSSTVVVAVENLNPDRATLLFSVPVAHYEAVLEHIHSFLKSVKVNKRSTLRTDDYLVSTLGANSFAAINHKDEPPYEWRDMMNYKLSSM